MALDDAVMVLVDAGFVLAFAAWAALGSARTASRKRHVGALGPSLQAFAFWLLGPLERRLVARRALPDGITLASVLIAFGAAGASAYGRFALAGWLYMLSGFVDILDGRVARATGRVTPSGAFLDSVGDRVAEAAVLSGVALFYGRGVGLALALAALTSSFLVSYIRARGESLGLDALDVGAVQRPERIATLATAMILSALGGELFAQAGHPLVLAALGVVTLASVVTAVRRAAAVYRALRHRTDGD